MGGYLATRPSLTGVVIVMDARRPFMPADEWLIDFLSRTHVRQLWLINKCDQIGNVLSAPRSSQLHVLATKQATKFPFSLRIKKRRG